MPTSRRPEIDRNASLRSVQKGGLPTHAKLRLREEAGPNRKLFTSDLSVNELLLTTDAQCQAISQVMGSSIYHDAKTPDYKGRTGELESLSHGHRDARRRAIRRLEQEATLVEADAVIGVRLEERLITLGQYGKGGDDGDQVLE